MFRIITPAMFDIVADSDAEMWVMDYMILPLTYMTIG